jgi:hypothetical protein
MVNPYKYLKIHGAFMRKQKSMVYLFGFFYILCAHLLIGKLVNAGESKRHALEKITNGPTCWTLKKNGIDRCIYTVQNLPNASKLLEKIRSTVFNDGFGPTPGTGKDDGMLHASGDELTFWHNNKNKLKAIKTAIKYFDGLEKFDTRPKVKIRVEVYSITEEGHSNLEGSLENFIHSVASLAGAVEIAKAASGIIGIQGSFDHTSLSLAINAGRFNNDIKTLYSAETTARNYSSFNLEEKVNIHIEPTPGQKVLEESGFSVSGREVSIAGTEKKIIKIEGLSLFHGVLDEGGESDNFKRIDDTVSALKRYYNVLDLKDGAPQILVTSDLVYKEKKRSFSIFDFNLKNENRHKKLMVVISARSVAFDGVTSEDQDELNLRKSLTFTQQEVVEFPRDNLSLEELFESLSIESHFLESRELSMRIKLDKELARKNNIKKGVEVKISGAGYKVKKMVTAESLMLSGFVLPTVAPKNYKHFNDGMVELKVKLSPFGGGRSVKKTFYYIPQTNEFIEK